MKKIYRYNSTNRTGFEVVDVADDYELQKGELLELPNPVYTPMILDDDGNLVSNTLEASNAEAQAFLEREGITPYIDPNDAKITSLAELVTANNDTHVANNATTLALIANLQAQIDTLKGGA